MCALEARERPVFCWGGAAVRPAAPNKRAAAVARDGARREGRHRRREQRGPRGGRRRRALGRFSLYWALRAASFLPLHLLLHSLLFLLKALFFLTEPPRFAILAAGGRRRVAAAAATHVLRAVFTSGDDPCVACSIYSNAGLQFCSSYARTLSALLELLLLAAGATRRRHTAYEAASCQVLSTPKTSIAARSSRNERSKRN